MVDELSDQDVLVVLNKLSVFSQDKDLRCVLDKINVKTLRKLLEAMGLPSTAKKKPELQRCCFGAILNREIMQSGSSVEKGGPTAPIERKFVWDKGGWLSLLANITEQIRYLGPLVWIW